MTETSEKQPSAASEEEQQIAKDLAKGREGMRAGRKILQTSMGVLTASVACSVVSLGVAFSNQAKDRKQSGLGYLLSDAVNLLLPLGIGLGVWGYLRQELGELRVDQATFRQKYLAEKVNQQIAAKEPVQQVS